MAVYASAADLAAYVADNPELPLPAAPEAQERLLARAERAVDLVLGPWPRFANGRKLDPAALDTTQRAALSRATCAAAEHLAMLDPAFWVGDDDFLPNEVSILRRAPRVSPRMLEELAGHGLLKRSGTVASSPTSVGFNLSAQAPAAVVAPALARVGEDVLSSTVRRLLPDAAGAVSPTLDNGAA